MGANITPTSLSRGRGVSIDNVASTVQVQTKPQKILLIGSALAANTSGGTYTAATRTRVYSADQVGSLAGFGSCIHRTAVKVFRGQGSTCEVHVVIQPEVPSTAVAATGTFAVTHAATASGTLALYIDGDRYPIAVDSAMSATAIGDAIVAALAAEPSCPVTGVNTTGSVALTAKNKGANGNDISIKLNQLGGDVTPAGFTSTITPMTSGATDPDLTTALNALGTGNSANYNGDTIFVVCYARLDSTNMAELSTYNGTANEIEACYLDTVGRPFMCFWGDTDPGTDALTALAAIGNGVRETDKTNVIIPVPNSMHNPTGLAGIAAGMVAARAHVNPESPYGGMIMPGISASPLTALAAATGDWTVEPANRETAVKAGISTTITENGVVKLNDVVTTYHPTTISAYSNCYRLVNNIMKVMNMNYAWRTLLTSSTFDQITIVSDVAKVTSQAARQHVMDRDSIWGYTVDITTQFEGLAWIWSAASTLDVMKTDLDYYIALRSGGLGWDVIHPVYLSGSLEILTVKIAVDADASAAA